MDLSNFNLDPIDLAKEGWDVNQAAEFYGVTPGEFLIGIEHGKYHPGVDVHGRRRWHPGLLRCIRAAEKEGFELFHMEPRSDWTAWV